MIIRKSKPEKNEAMKTMKTILSIAALALTGALMSSCGTDDDIIENAPQIVGEQTDKKDNIVVVTTTVNRGAQTKALTPEGVKTFAVGEQIALCYDETTLELTVMAVSEPLTEGDITNGGKTAKFTFTLKNPQTTCDVSFVYPAAMATEIWGDPDYSKLDTQDGTLSYLAANCDLATGSGKMTDLELPEEVTLENQLAILAITLKNSEGTDITKDITRLTLDVLSVLPEPHFYTVERDAGAGPIYVAMQRVVEGNIEVTASTGTKYYTKTLTGKNYEANQGYNVGWIMTELPAQASTLSELKTAINSGADCSNYIGWQVNSEGAIAESVSGTKIGYVAYVSTSDVDASVPNSRILVIASADVSEDKLAWGNDYYVYGLYDELNGYGNTKELDGYYGGYGESPAAHFAWNYSATIPGGGAQPAHWFMPGVRQWTNMRDAQSGADDQAKRNAMNTAYGLDGGDYWSSTCQEYGNASFFSENGGARQNERGVQYRVRACFAY